MESKRLEQQFFTGERALFGAHDLTVSHSTFADGESPLKESRNIALLGSMFKWKYPLWYSHHVRLEDCTLFETARAGIWYTDDVTVKNCLIEAPKIFRRCRGVSLDGVEFPNAAETLWHCTDVAMRAVHAKGDYFAMNCENVTAEDLTLFGNYSFDGAKNVTVRRARMLSKDAFWNSENVTVYDSFIAGEYLGWNAKNLTLINCTVESLQGLCYIENLKMENCRLLNTTLCFEYSTLEADIVGKVDSVLNPSGGRITADRIDTLILEKDKIDPEKTVIVCRAAAESMVGGRKGEKDDV